MGRGKRWTDAFNRICDLTECSKEDVERLREIFSSARMYFDLYFRLQDFRKVKSRVEKLKAMVAQLTAER